MMIARETRWQTSLARCSFLEFFEAAYIWKIRFVFTNMGPNIKVMDIWNPALPKMQSPSCGRKIWTITVVNERYTPVRITRSMCSPDPLITRKYRFLMVIIVIMNVKNRPQPDNPANIAPYKFRQPKNVWGISVHSSWFSSIGHCLSGHNSHEVSLSTRISFLRHAKHCQQQNWSPTTLKWAAGQGALHLW